jgi:hypothetical protein
MAYSERKVPFFDHFSLGSQHILERKVLFEQDFPLQCILVHDHLSKQIYSCTHTTVRVSTAPSTLTRKW